MKTADGLWNAAPGGLKPPDGKGHVLSALLDVPAIRLEELVSWPSEDEWQRPKRLHLQRDCRRFIAGRGRLREILAALLDINPASLAFSYDKFGKPQIAAPTPAHSLHFNPAHSDSLAVGFYPISQGDFPVYSHGSEYREHDAINP